MDFPKPLIPTQPVLSLASLEGGHCTSENVLDAGQARFVTSGRMATALALAEMQIGPGDKVLIPAYHCISMVSPVIWRGAAPCFYRIHPDTSVDLEDVRNKLDASTKAIMIVHYFGFPQDAHGIRTFCDRHGLLLLEDCAHAFFGSTRGKPLGSFGDYAIASTTKFFPVYDGGCLISARHDLGKIPLDGSGIAFEMKCALNTLEKGFAYNRMKPLRALLASPMRLKNLVWKKIKRSSSDTRKPIGPGSSDGGLGFEPAWISRRSSLMSRLVMHHALRERIVRRRRENFEALRQALNDVPGCRPLFDVLPDGVVPYVLPIVADEPEKVFLDLKRAGVPVIRFAEELWEGIDERTCPISTDLSRRVLQFPCHQELLPHELNWMIAQVRRAFLMHRKSRHDVEVLSH